MNYMDQQFVLLKDYRAFWLMLNKSFKFIVSTTKNMKQIVAFLFLLAVSIINGFLITAQNFTLVPSMDNTIFSESDSSNGSGIYLFTGTTNQGGERRALLKFDLTTLQSYNLITSAELQLYVSKTIHDEKSVSLYRLTGNWGEGTSDALGEEGMGATPSDGDATWKDAFYDTVPWLTSGGDYLNVPSATTLVNQAESYYSWTGSGVLADVREWMANPEANYGWIVITEGETSAKRINSRENPDFPPQLILKVSVTSTQENFQLNKLAIFPNPSDGKIHISGLSANKTFKLRICNVTGSVVMERIIQSTQDGNITVNISEKGIYFIRIDTLFVGKVLIF